MLQAEEKAKYDAWLPTWEGQLTPERDKLLKLTTKLRNEEVKEGGRDPKVEMEEIALNELIGLQDDRSHPSYGYHYFGTPQTLTGSEPVKNYRAKHYFETDDGRKEVITMCSEYLAYLRQLVEDFLSAHP